MREAVSDILDMRARQAEGLNRMVMVSFGAHLALLLVIVLLPENWRSAPVPPETTAMTIMLGGSPGPQAGGMTPIAGRAVQAVAPTPARPTPQSPAAATPSMTVPDPTTRPAPRPQPPVQKPAERSASRSPTTGPEIKSGAARVETGGQAIPFGGLTTGGGGGSTGGYLDVKDFCCPAYLQTMVQVIQANWKSQQGEAGQVQVKFTVQRDGRLTNVEVEKPSGHFLLDTAAQRAVLMTRQLAPLPREFPEETLTVHLIFQYHR